MRWLGLALAALLVSAPVSGQEWQVTREQFAFAGSRLTIRVEASRSGTLRVIRGGPGTVRVAGRAEHGFAAAGLSENEELTLTAAGQGLVDYLVSVPDRVWIEVRLPGRSFAESMPGSARSRTFQWPSGLELRRSVPPAWAPAPDEAPLYTTYTRERSPRIVRIPDLANIRSLGVRIEDGPFRVRTSRPLSLERGADDQLEILADHPPIDLVITIPRDTPDFRLDAGTTTALLVRGDSVAVLCSSVTDQRLSHGRRWLTFTPDHGQLPCRP